jgi:hypothetical protein
LFHNIAAILALPRWLGYIEVFSKRAQKERKEDFDNVSGWQRLGQAL